MRSRILIGLICGSAGGFLGWLLQENLLDYNAFLLRDMPAYATRTLVLCVGGLIGMWLGAVDGIVEGNTRKLARGLLVGLLGGVLFGFIGFFFGNVIFNALGGRADSTPGEGLLGFTRQVIARSFGWAGLGVGLGVGASLATLSSRRIWHGAVGGFLGGFLGGFVFDILAITMKPVHQALGEPGLRDVGGQSRMVGFTAIGGLTGFFIGLVEELLKQAWVRVLVGRNEGKDFILSRPMNILGRDERCDVPLYGDMNVAPQHAAIRADDNRHVLMDAGTPVGTLVNGQRVPPGGELLLRDGDMIQIGTHRILFREKATAARFAREPVDAPRSQPVTPSSVPMPAHLCPFCGTPKDAVGNCQCSVIGALVGMPDWAQTVPGAYSGVSRYPASGGQDIAAAGGATMPRLVGVEGPYAGQVFLLNNPVTFLGREPDRDIVLSADTTVSRNHARLVNEQGQFVLYDNGSANGTFVNGLRISMQVLAPGDLVQFGASKFRFE